MRKERKWVVIYSCIFLLTLLVARWSSRVVTVFVETAPIKRGLTIVIDPGHGGEDGGATSCTGYLESRINLEISMCLRDLFHFLGYNTRMIRTEDLSVYREGDTIAQKKISDLKERVKMVNKTENPILLSIHQNHFPDGRYSGAQVFYAGTEGSQSLATALQRSFVTKLNPESKRKEKRASGVYLMEHITCPGVLIECGFLSNPEEEAMLRSKNYQKKLCCVIASTVSTYLSNT